MTYTYFELSMRGKIRAVSLYGEEVGVSQTSKKEDVIKAFAGWRFNEHGERMA